jgi:hypothetical protein
MPPLPRGLQNCDRPGHKPSCSVHHPGWLRSAPCYPSPGANMFSRRSPATSAWLSSANLSGCCAVPTAMTATPSLRSWKGYCHLLNSKRRNRPWPGVPYPAIDRDLLILPTTLSARLARKWMHHQSTHSTGKRHVAHGSSLSRCRAEIWACSGSVPGGGQDRSPRPEFPFVHRMSEVYP